MKECRAHFKEISFPSCNFYQLHICGIIVGWLKIASLYLQIPENLCHFENWDGDFYLFLFEIRTCDYKLGKELQGLSFGHNFQPQI